VTDLLEKNFLGLSCYEESVDEIYMNKKQLAHFTHVLSTWYKALLSEVDSVVTSLQKEPGSFDHIDRAAFEESQRMELRSSDRRRRLQEKIAKTLIRIQKGDYGYCKTCSAEIGVRRLDARPTADECINCKTISEIYEVRG
jgi:DnaK suppressor protein